MAIALTVLALSLLMLWEENYGYAHDAAAGGTEPSGPQEQSGPEALPRAASGGEKAAILPAAGGGGPAAAAPEADGGHAIDGKTLTANGGTKRGDGGDGHAIGGEDGDQGAGLDGEGGLGVGAGGIGAGAGLRRSVSLAWRCIRSDPRVLLLGMVQSFFEGGTYTFGERKHAAAVVGLGCRAGGDEVVLLQAESLPSFAMIVYRLLFPCQPIGCSFDRL